MADQAKCPGAPRMSFASLPAPLDIAAVLEWQQAQVSQVDRQMVEDKPCTAPVIRGPTADSCIHKKTPSEGVERPSPSAVFFSKGDPKHTGATADAPSAPRQPSPQGTQAPRIMTTSGPSHLTVFQHERAAARLQSLLIKYHQEMAEAVAQQFVQKYEAAGKLS